MAHRTRRIAAMVALAVVALGPSHAAAAGTTTGWLDPTFGSGGVVVVPSLSSTRFVTANVEAGPTGRIFVYSYRRTAAGGSRLELTAFTPNGRLDPGFNGGKPRTVFVEFLGDPECCLTAGPFPTVDGGAEVLIGFFDVFLVRRYTATGAVMWTTRLDGAGLSMAKLAGNSARILSFDFHAPEPPRPDMSLRGLTPTGALDLNVGPDGTRPLETQVGPNAIVADRLNRLYVVGNEYGASDRTGIETTRRTSSGALDATWGTSGRTVIPVDASDTSPARARGEAARGVALSVDGSLYLAGEMRESATGNLVVVIRKLDPSGKLDSSFGNGGILTLPGPTGSSRFGAIALKADQVLFVSFVARGATLQPMLAALDAPTGEVEPTFGNGGFLAIAGFADDITVTGDLQLLSVSRVTGDGRAVLYLSRRR